MMVNVVWDIYVQQPCGIYTYIYTKEKEDRLIDEHSHPKENEERARAHIKLVYSDYPRRGTSKKILHNLVDEDDSKCHCCTSCGMSLNRNESSCWENLGLEASFTFASTASSASGPLNSETASVISWTKSTITPLTPMRCCMYTASGTLLQTQRNVIDQHQQAEQ